MCVCVCVCARARVLGEVQKDLCGQAGCAASVVTLKNIALKALLLIVVDTEQCWVLVDTVTAAGAFPSELGWLTHMQELDLSGQSNMFFGLPYILFSHRK